MPRRNRSANKTSAEVTSGEAANNRGPRVLLVEDNPVNQKIALRMLQKMGHAVEVAANGAEAVHKCSGSEFALVLMDISMPIMDGFEATQKIREHESSKGGHVPIVALTANAMEGDREKCLAAGMDDYLSKPVRAESLEKMIASVVHRLGPVAG
jgi:CheY-like chemotaxis protein